MPNWGKTTLNSGWHRFIPSATIAVPTLGFRRTMVAQIKTPSTHPAGTGRAAFLADDPGIPALPVEKLLEAHRELIDRIKLCFGMDRAGFELSVMPLLYRYAAAVHLLPCTANSFFSAPGGLLRIGLETAFYALQGTDAHIFSGRSTISERTSLEPRWRRATFIAGLCSELHRVFTQTIVTCPTGSEWSPYLVPLTGWLHQHGIQRYFLKWQPNAREHRALGLFAAPFVVTAEDLQDLDAGRSQIVSHMLATIAGTSLAREHNILESLVRRALALVIDSELRSEAQRLGNAPPAAHLERYLVDALRHLAASKASWRANAEKSRLWFGAEGMFLIWPNAFEDLGKHFEAAGLPGIPKTPGELLEILSAAGAFVPREEGGMFWGIYPPGSSARFDAVRLVFPGLLFANTDEYPEPLAASLLKPSIAPVPLPQRPPSTTVFRPAPPIGAGAPAAVTEPAARNAEPEQLSLLAETATKPVPLNKPTEMSATPALPAADPQYVKPALKAPLRLPLTIKRALEDILKGLGAGSESEASLTDAGLFVSLDAFKARKLDAPPLLRALNEAGMFAGQAPVTCLFRGKDTRGVLIARRFIQGIPGKAAEDADTCL